MIACGGHTSWQGNLREPWQKEPQGVQELPMDITWSFALPQLPLGGGWWSEGKAFLMVGNVRWIREEGEKYFSKDGW